jgi:hypothetical protein
MAVLAAARLRVQFFRDPQRPIPAQPNAVLARPTAASSRSKRTIRMRTAKR